MTGNTKLRVGQGGAPLELLQQLADPVLLLRQDGRIRFLNAAAEDLFGRTWDALVGEAFAYLLPVEGTREIEITRPDGTKVIVEVRQRTVDWDAERHRLLSMRDVSRRREIENTLATAKARYELATLGSNDGLWDWDLRSDQIYFSPRWKQLLGYEDQEIANDKSAWLRRVHPEDIERLNADLYSHFHGFARQLRIEHRLLRKDGTYEWFLATGSALRGFDGQAIRIAGSLTNIQTRKQFEENITFVANHDPLTGLPNRGCCVQRLEEILARAARRPQLGYAVLFVDVDGLKGVNDTFGHERGDELLVEVSERLKRSIRVGDLAGRLGGDEFVVILDDISDESDALRVADRIERELEVPWEAGERSLALSASIGIALARADYQNPEQVLRDADQAMYVAKKTGKGRSVIFDRDAHREACAVLALEKELRVAMDRGDLSVHFQPICDCDRERRPIGFEALIRWEHPERGLLLPGSFLPSIREAALRRTLDAWVLRRSCQAAVQWMTTTGTGPVIQVNLSSHSWNDPSLDATIRRVVEVTGFPAERLVLELAGSILRHDQETVGRLDRMKELGVAVIIDDCGGSAIALPLLGHPAVRGLKIGREWLRKTTGSEQLTDVARGLLCLGRAFRLPVTACGVEDPAMIDWLREGGCSFAQGFVFSGALPPAEAHDLWQRAPGNSERP